MRKIKVALKLTNKHTFKNVFCIWVKYLYTNLNMITLNNKNDSKSKLLFTETDSLIYEIKSEGVYGFSNDKGLLDFSSYLNIWKYYDNSNKLVIWKMKDETSGVAIEGFVELKPKIYSFLVDDNSGHAKPKDVNKMLLRQ